MLVKTEGIATATSRYWKAWTHLKIIPRPKMPENITLAPRVDVTGQDLPCWLIIVKVTLLSSSRTIDGPKRPTSSKSRALHTLGDSRPAWAGLPPPPKTHGSTAGPVGRQSSWTRRRLIFHTPQSPTPHTSRDESSRPPFSYCRVTHPPPHSRAFTSRLRQRTRKSS